MPKVNDIAKSTAHSQAAEVQAVLGSASATLTKQIADLQAQASELEDKLHDATVAHAAAADDVTRLTAELAAEKEAHAATQAALTAATTATTTPAA